MTITPTTFSSVSDVEILSNRSPFNSKTVKRILQIVHIRWMILRFIIHMKWMRISIKELISK